MGACLQLVLRGFCGLPIQVLVQDGDTVQQGDPLVVLEAMKMEHTVTAPCDGQARKRCRRSLTRSAHQPKKGERRRRCKAQK